VRTFSGGGELRDLLQVRAPAPLPPAPLLSTCAPMPLRTCSAPARLPRC
jgi:hypothetical protein